MKKPTRVKKMRFEIDMHVHSTCSDGALSPTALVEMAAERGLTGFALTDHDTTRGVQEARLAAEEHGIEVIAGIEVSAWFEREIHILGYFIDPNHSALTQITQNQKAAREMRLREMCRRLGNMGLEIDPEPIVAAAPMRTIGRPHLAEAMLAAGYVRTFDEAFQRFLGAGKPAYVPASQLPAAEAIKRIQQAGGVAVVAHPGVDRLLHAIPKLAEAGLDGVEVHHPAHDRYTASRFWQVARRLNLQATGGSDFHRPGGSAGLGSYGLNPGDLAALRKRRRRA
jgi:3',5'-nucleoside bisphosphate phosphatase